MEGLPRVVGSKDNLAAGAATDMSCLCDHRISRGQQEYTGPYLCALAVMRWPASHLTYGTQLSDALPTSFSVRFDVVHSYAAVDLLHSRKGVRGTLQGNYRPTS